MAINPLSSALTSASLPTPAPQTQTQDPSTTPQTSNPQQTPPTQQRLQAIEAQTMDPMLVDPSSANGSSTSTGSSDPLLSFSSMTGGDPLLGDLNALDNSSLTGSSSNSEDAALNQELTSFFMQQATGFYNASRLLGSIDPSSGSTAALGNTTA